MFLVVFWRNMNIVDGNSRDGRRGSPGSNLMFAMHPQTADRLDRWSRK